MTAFPKDYLRMDMKNKTAPTGTKKPSIKIDKVEKTDRNPDQSAPRPSPRLPAYVHPH